MVSIFCMCASVHHDLSARAPVGASIVATTAANITSLSMASSKIIFLRRSMCRLAAHR
jgi:hypothetical protein